MQKLKDKNNKLEYKVKNMSDQLSKTFGIVFSRLMDIEKEQVEQQKSVQVKESKVSDTEEELLKKAGADDKIKATNKAGKTKGGQQHKNKCDHCDFKGKNQVTLSKHVNKKHAQDKAEHAQTKTVADLECALCDDKFSSNPDFQEHIKEHLEEIKEINIYSLTNGHDIFECNLCSFESGHINSIREHLITHVMVPKASEKRENTNKNVLQRK